MATKCYVTRGKSVNYGIRCHYANHPIVCSSMVVSYGRIVFHKAMSIITVGIGTVAPWDASRQDDRKAT